MSNSIKFTPSGGEISINLKILTVSDLGEEEEKEVKAGSIKSDMVKSEESAPDKEVKDTPRSIHHLSVNSQKQKQEKMLSF
mmetsp:Transcript_44917/g.59628  ORF Transcript_44917/g.59628 Transcript_44917/m.59628 type:complete len:81 (-) Transcript_44917:1423-1665(-)